MTGPRRVEDTVPLPAALLRQLVLLPPVHRDPLVWRASRLAGRWRALRLARVLREHERRAGWVREARDCPTVETWYGQLRGQ